MRNCGTNPRFFSLCVLLPSESTDGTTWTKDSVALPTRQDDEFPLRVLVHLPTRDQAHMPDVDLQSRKRHSSNLSHLAIRKKRTKRHPTTSHGNQILVGQASPWIVVERIFLKSSFHNCLMSHCVKKHPRGSFAKKCNCAPQLRRSFGFG